MAKLKAFNVGPVTTRSMPFWCVANELADPFGRPVLDHLDSVTVCDIICWAARGGLIEQTSFHDDDLVPWDPKNPEDDLDRKSEAYATLKQIKQKLDEAGVTTNTATCSLHSNPIFRRGGLTNPDRRIRELARLKVERTLRIGKMFGAKYFTYWVARDGYEVGAKVPWKNVHNWLAEALDHAHDYIKANNFRNYIGATIEPKPNEPRGHMFIPTAGHAVGFICSRLKNPDFWGVNPELLQHESMTLLDALNTLSFLVATNKLFFLHFGNQIKGQFDNDFPPLIGPEGLKETAQMFWLLRQLGWKGVVEYDCHMLRCEADTKDQIGCRKEFIRNASTALTIALELADRLGKTKVAGLSESQADLRSIMNMCGLSQKRVNAITTKR